jgi:FKBP-type peptidyl-prolyl cis-trans isomerase SlyD
MARNKEFHMSDELNVQDGHVVSMDYVLHIDGELIDESEAGDPLEFIQGQGHIIPGLEKALYGLAIGDTRSLKISAEEGYGEIDQDAFVDLPRDQFPGDIPMEVGTNLQLQHQDGSMMQARIDEVGEDIVRLDFNHPLAGKNLHFDIKIVALRPATEEEIDHGHIHDGEEEDEEE